MNEASSAYEAGVEAAKKIYCESAEDVRALKGDDLRRIALSHAPQDGACRERFVRGFCSAWADIRLHHGMAMVGYSPKDYE